MKANAPKRQIFDAVDLLTDEMPAVQAVAENSIRMLNVDSLRPFEKSPFRLYEGERMAEMVENVKEHGILNPVIVQEIPDGYRMLSGHNRLEAAKHSGITEIPAIVKKDLTEQEAWVYVIETNMLQRSFAELSYSEKAAVLAERYDKIISQGKRNDIILELEVLSGGGSTCGHDDHKCEGRSRVSLGEEYGMSESSVARLLRVNKLIPELKEKLDNGELNLTAAVQLSYADEEIQQAAAAADRPISREMAVQLRAEDMTPDAARAILTEPAQKKPKAAGRSVRLPADVYERYFHQTDAKTAAEIIEAALKAWFAGKEAADV